MLGRKNVLLTTIFIAICVFGWLGSCFGTYDLFYQLSHDWLRALLVVATVEGAIILYGFWALKADDKVTFALTVILTLLYFAVALAFQIADGAIKDANGQLAGVISEQVKWVVNNLVWVPPTLTAGIAFFVHLLDQRMGHTWEPILKEETTKPGRSQNGKLPVVYGNPEELPKV